MSTRALPTVTPGGINTIGVVPGAFVAVGTKILWVVLDELGEFGETPAPISSNHSGGAVFTFPADASAVIATPAALLTTRYIELVAAHTVDVAGDGFGVVHRSLRSLRQII